MSKVEIVGNERSVCVQTVRIVAEEKGVEYIHRSAAPHSPESAVHPLGKIPVMHHGAVSLFESRAIALYLDRAFEGPSLTSLDAERGASIEQWVSMSISSFDPVLIRQYLVGYLFPGTSDGSPDVARIEQAMPRVTSHLAIVEKQLTGQDYIAGPTFTLADAFVAPILLNIEKLPEAGALIAASPRLADYNRRVLVRPSVAAAMSTRV